MDGWCLASSPKPLLPAHEPGDTGDRCLVVHLLGLDQGRLEGDGDLVDVLR